MSLKLSLLRSNQPLTGEGAPISRKRAFRMVKNGRIREITPILFQEIEAGLVERLTMRGRVVHMPRLRAIRRPDWIFTAYPLADQRTVSL